MKKLLIVGMIIFIAGLVVLIIRKERPLTKVMATEVHEEKAQRILPDSERMLTEFETSKDPDWLSKAIAMTQHQEADFPEEAIANRMALVKRLSSYYNPSYDANPPALPQVNVMPPMGYETGVQPEEIEDLQLREDYQNRIEENIINSREHKVQTAIRRSMFNAVYLLLSQKNNNITDVEQYLISQKLSKEMFDSMMSMVHEETAR